MADFNIPFSSSANYIYDANNIEVAEGVLRLTRRRRDDLVFYYPFNDASESLIPDHSGNGNDLIFAPTRASYHHTGPSLFPPPINDYSRHDLIVPGMNGNGVQIGGDVTMVTQTKQNEFTYDTDEFTFSVWVNKSNVAYIASFKERHDGQIIRQTFFNAATCLLYRDEVMQIGGASNGGCPNNDFRVQVSIRAPLNPSQPYYLVGYAAIIDLGSPPYNEWALLTVRASLPKNKTDVFLNGELVGSAKFHYRNYRNPPNSPDYTYVAGDTFSLLKFGRTARELGTAFTGETYVRTRDDNDHYVSACKVSKIDEYIMVGAWLPDALIANEAQYPGSLAYSYSTDLVNADTKLYDISNASQLVSFTELLGQTNGSPYSPRYFLSVDGKQTWLYYNGVNWANSGTNPALSMTASQVNAAISKLDVEYKDTLAVRIFLQSDGLHESALDNINITYKAQAVNNIPFKFSIPVYNTRDLVPFQFNVPKERWITAGQFKFGVHHWKFIDVMHQDLDTIWVGLDDLNKEE